MSKEPKILCLYDGDMTEYDPDVMGDRNTYMDMRNVQRLIENFMTIIENQDKTVRMIEADRNALIEEIKYEMSQNKKLREALEIAEHNEERYKRECECWKKALVKTQHKGTLDAFMEFAEEFKENEK